MLRGKKVVLRPIDIDRDLENFYHWINDPEVNQFLGRPLMPITRENERKKLHEMLSDKDTIVFAIDTLEGKHIGITGLHHISLVNRSAVTGTFIGDPSDWSKGYGTDAKMALLEYAFRELNLRRIESTVLAFNIRSLKCQLRCGYKIEGRKEKVFYKNRNWHDVIMLAVFQGAWFKQEIWHAYMHQQQ